MDIWPYSCLLYLGGYQNNQEQIVEDSNPAFQQVNQLLDHQSNTKADEQLKVKSTGKSNLNQFEILDRLF